MSGDVQPRKRKEKRKKKEDSVDEFSNNFSSDENIHVHKEAGTGGNICTKIIFFALLGVLLILVGLIITEYRGSTDLDNPITESRWAPIFDGWVDDSKDDHDDHEPGDHADDVHDDQDDHDEDHDDEDDHDDEHVDEVEDEDEGEDEEGTTGEPAASGEEDEATGAEDDDDDDEEEEDNGDDDDDDDDVADEDDDGTTAEDDDDVTAAEGDDDEDDDEDGDKGDDDDEADDDDGIPGVKASVEAGDGQDDDDDDNDDDNNEANDGEDDDDNDDDNINAPEGVQHGRHKINQVDDDDDDDDGDNIDDDDDNPEGDNKSGNDAAQDDDDDDDNGDDDDENADDDDDDDDDDDNDDDDEPEPAGASAKSPLQTSQSNIKVESEPQESRGPSTSGGKSEDLDDWVLQNELDAAEADFDDRNPEAALKKFSSILMKYPDSVQAHYGMAKALDTVAELKRSNTLLDQAIEEYQKILNFPKPISDALFLQVAERCLNRMRFKGQYSKAVNVHKSLIVRFPDEPSHPNQLAVTYLIMNRIQEAKLLLIDTLKKWPSNGFAQVHYGFILKTSDNNMTGAVDYLHKGILSRELGTIDGRFFFQLGDALMRLGRKDEAMKINELGVKEGLFLSKYQRSLYNVDRLSAQPWWTMKETTYEPHFKKLISNWKVIQKEGLNALYNSSLNLYKDESENLKDSGQWQQLELFARGRKITPNCVNAPVTCSIIESFPAARNCKRGQVKFSVMQPGTHVWPHCGPTNCRLRAHLGLVVPKGTFIRVAEETRQWEEGNLIIFDDSFEHEVWHNGSTTRLVLIVDVWHPDLSEKEKNNLSPI